jgi:undecaprenyl-diphosphatase
MTLWQAALLGVLQGLTEFLPVSSSGHLALAQLLIPGFSQPGVVFDAMLHVGTAGAVLCFERRRLLAWIGAASGLRMLALLVGGTFATAVVALPLRAPATAAFADPVWVGAALILTGVVVASTRWLPGGPRGERETGWRQAAAIGLAQGLAVFPGLSRSGMTIAAGLGSGLDRTWAAHFSFLLAVPAILAATVVEVADAWRAGVGLEPGLVGACAVGVPCAALTGFVALRFVIRSLSSASFHRFAWYCIPLGLVAVLWGLG